MTQNEINEFHIKNLNNFYNQYWFSMNTGFAGIPVLQGSWLRRKTDFAVKLVCRETGLTGKLVWQGNVFLFTFAKTFTAMLVVK